jgi:glycosyltransferase involved in cell wall biosynthesis
MKNPYVSVIIPAKNEEGTIYKVIKEANKVHENTEVIVVVNGSSDSTFGQAQKAGAKILHFDYSLGHDLGRAIGAIHAKGEILLFLDGDFYIPFSLLQPYIHSIGVSECDIALNYYPNRTTKMNAHTATLKFLLNSYFNHHSLQGASLTNVPHAMSRKALNEIGIEHLAIPPLAQAIAMFKRINVKGINYLPVHKKNKKRTEKENSKSIEWVIQTQLYTLDQILKYERGENSIFNLTH